MASPEGVEPAARRLKGNRWLPLQLDNHFRNTNARLCASKD